MATKIFNRDVELAGESQLTKDSVNLLPFRVVTAGLSTSETDANATVTVSLSGILATDVVVATLKAAANAVYVTKAVCSTDTITVTLSGNGGAGTIVNYVVYRAV